MRPPIIIVIAVAFIILYAIITVEIPGIWKFFLGLLEMFIVGQLLIKYYKLTGDHGLILLRSKKGISLISRIAKNKKLWNFFSDVGIVISYGLLSPILMKKHVSWKSFITGFILLGVIFFFVTPSAVAFLTSVLEFSLLERSTEQLSDISPLLSMSIFLVFIGGFFLILLLSIIGWGVVVLLALINTVVEGSSAISETLPGGTLLLPGINLPFFEGITALLIILVVHEGAHAVLARIAKIPILSSGLVLFGVIPIGAFVEPDEDKLKKLPQVPQTRVLAAGSTANFLTSLVFFLAFLIFVIGTTTLALNEIPVLLPFLRFVSVVLGLTFALNFIVGTVNLLPLPFFDGYRTLEINVPHKTVLHFIAFVTVVAFLLNFLPWLFM